MRAFSYDSRDDQNISHAAKAFMRRIAHAQTDGHALRDEDRRGNGFELLSFVITEGMEWKDHGVSWKVNDGKNFVLDPKLKGESRVDALNAAIRENLITITYWSPRMFECHADQLEHRGEIIHVNGSIDSEITLMGDGYDETYHKLQLTMKRL